ncbi:hypothetical protein V5799_011350 [Amblyomma americanum]|uniref:Tick transposon n=1 Tax=Amblyomma americanum TaxID=6943 RepID=A0AAQ4EHD4_AMBAM
MKKVFGPRIPLLFTPLSKELTFRHANSHEIRDQVVSNADEWPPYRKITRTGCFAISVRTGDAASRLLELTSLAGVPCKVSIPRWYSSNVRKIQGVPQRYSERQLLEHFYGIGVIYVRRQVNHRRDPDGTVRARPQQGVVLYFRPNVQLPSKVRLGLVSFDLLPFTATPTQCMNCQRYFHIARHCDSPTRCKICAGFHNFRVCTRRDKVRCCNCLGRHVASFAGCPTRLRATSSKWRNMQRLAQERNDASSGPGDAKNKKP